MLFRAAAANQVCGVGVAFGAKVSGIRMLDGTVTDILEGRSFIYKAHVNWIYSCRYCHDNQCLLQCSACMYICTYMYVHMYMIL